MITDIISLASGAVNDIFSAEGYKKKAKASLYEAEGARIQARGMRMRKQGQILEGERYDRAGVLADRNAEFSRISTAIKDEQAGRSILRVMGGQRADVAGSGFAAGGTAIDLMRSSASEGALTRAVLGQQGLIEEAGYKEQAESFRIMGKVSRFSAEQSELAALGLEQSALAHEQNAGAAEDAAKAAQITGTIKGGAFGWIAKELFT